MVVPTPPPRPPPDRRLDFDFPGGVRQITRAARTFCIDVAPMPGLAGPSLGEIDEPKLVGGSPREGKNGRSSAAPSGAKRRTDHACIPAVAFRLAPPPRDDRTEPRGVRIRRLGGPGGGAGRSGLPFLTALVFRLLPLTTRQRGVERPLYESGPLRSRVGSASHTSASQKACAPPFVLRYICGVGRTAGHTCAESEVCGEGKCSRDSGAGTPA